MKTLKIIKILFFCILFIQSFTYVNADTTTITYAWTAIDWWGAYSWINTSNATWNTTTTFTSSSPARNNSTNQIILTNFNLTSAWIPSDALIDWIQVEVERNVNWDRTRDTTVQLTKDWTNWTGNNYANNSDGPTTKSTTIYWWSTDLWWTSWTTSELISNNFWVILQYNTTRNNRTINVYRVMITVDYTPLTESMTWNILDFETTWWYTITEWTWTRTTNNPYEWSYSLESWNHTDNTNSCFRVTKDVTSDTTLTFYKTVSSESNYDFLRFYIDWVQQNEWSWEVSWSQESYPLTTWFYTFEWCYEKDYSVSNWSDTAWVDLIEVQNDTINIINQVFHFDAFDIDWDWDTTDNPSEWSDVTSWNDLFNSNDATWTNAPTYNSASIKTHSWVVFSGSDYLDIWNDTAINTSSYDEKSFAIIFKTWDDINTLQNIYEQWGWVRWYAIQIENWQLYAWVWNNNEWQSWDQYKVLSTNIQQNTEYILIMNHDATNVSLANRTFEVILNWTSLWTLTNVDVQQSHTWDNELGRSWWAIQLSNSTGLWAWSNFTWAIWEFFSWNHALTSTEINDIYNYLYDKWLSADFPTAPWWIDSWLQIWLKSNAWTSTNTDWTSLNTWNDQSWNWYNATAWVAPTYNYSTTNNLNFYPIIDFNGSTQYLENTWGWAYSQSYFAVVIPDNQVDGTISWWVPFAFNCDTASLNTWTCWLPFWWLVLWAFTVAINDEVITHAIWSSNNWRSAQIWSASYSAWKPMLINMNENSSWTWTEISEKWILLDNYNANTYETLSATNYRLWISTDPANPFPYDWKIAEIINYSNRINTSDKTKIESYLSYKYWITLKNGTQNYIASNWTTNMWNTTTAWTYIYDIFWIGRDDNSWLWNVQSKSINNKSIITIQAIWEWSNINPTFVDIDNLEFLSISNNWLWNTWSQTDTPNWYLVLEKKWKVQENWELWTLNLDFNMANSLFDVPNFASGSLYYFIYDSDNDNNLADETPLAMTNTSGDIWQIAWIDLDNNQKFTIASIANNNNIPTDISLSNNNINENVIENSSIGTFSTIDADSWDSHTYSLIVGTWDDDNNYFTITWNTLKLIHSPDYEIKQTYSIRVETDDWNLWKYQEIFTININNLWETIPTSLNFENALDDYKYTNTSWIWARTTNNPYEWLYSLESNNLWNPNTQSCFEVNNTLTQTWTIEFYYSVSSQAWGDFLRFYIDNIEQQSWSWEIWWTQYSKTNVEAWTRIYKWCYIKDTVTNSWDDRARIDFVATQPTTTENNPPIISSINFASWVLLPWWNHEIIINYSDSESWIDTNSDNISLNKWNWTEWWIDISSTWINLWTKIITNTSAYYTTNSLNYWKYKYNFQISDNDTNTSSTWAIFYIDEPELIINSWSLDIWDIKANTTKFSSWELTITVKTVWAWFDLILNKESTLSWWTVEIIDWNWSEWFWYDKNPYTSTINLINTNEIIASQVQNINIDWFKNTYMYYIKLWSLVWEEQYAWNYEWLIKFWLKLYY